MLERFFFNGDGLLKEGGSLVAVMSKDGDDAEFA
jgi:hypothetical protein